MSEASKNPKPMSGILANVATFVMVSFLLLLLLIATLIVGAGILLVGRILTLVFTVSVFEASLIALGVAICIVYLVYQITRSPDFPRSARDDWDEDEDWDEYEDDEEEFDDEEDAAIIPPRSRNDSCPSGSGKKYKYCHGRAA
jgi:hypothetical protein